MVLVSDKPSNVLVFYRLNSAIERGTKPDALGWNPCHWTSTLKGIVCDIGGGTRPPHDQPPLIQYETQFPPGDPAMIGEAFPADLLGTPTFTHRMDQLDAVGVDDAEPRLGQPRKPASSPDGL